MRRRAILWGSAMGAAVLGGLALVRPRRETPLAPLESTPRLPPRDKLWTWIESLNAFGPG